MSAFVDSSVWFAAAAKRDAQNERAKSILRSIDQHLTTDLVLVETWQLLKAQFGGDVAEIFWERLRDAGVRIEPVMAADLEAAWEIERNGPEESYSRPNEFCADGASRGHPSRHLQPGVRSVPARQRPQEAVPDPEKATAKPSLRSSKRSLNAGPFA